MKILDRYVLRQLLITGIFAVLVLSVVLVLGNIFKQLLDLLVNHDAPLESILAVVGYIIPYSLTFSIPWGFLTAVLLLFGKMSAENEIIALRSSGVSITRTCIMVFVVAVLCAGTCLYINLIVAPRAQTKMKDAVYNLAISNPLSMFESDKVLDQFPGRKVYVERHQGSELYNLLVYELNENYEPMQVVYAKRGQLETDRENKRLLLHIYEGRFEQRDDQDPSSLAKIRQGITMQESTFPLSLAELYEKNKKKRGLSQMTIEELMDRLNTASLTGSQQELAKTATLTEVSKRFSFSLACIAFGLIGVPLAMTAQRKETSIGFLLSLLIAFAYYIFIILADFFKNKPHLHPEFLVWTPNVIFISLGLYLFWKLSRR